MLRCLTKLPPSRLTYDVFLLCFYRNRYSFLLRDDSCVDAKLRIRFYKLT